MRIGIVCPYSFDEPGGVQAHIIDLATVFIERGHHVQVLGPASPETSVPDFVVKGGRSLPVPYNGSVARLSLRPGVLAKTRDFINEGNFDVLHIHEPNSPSFSMAALLLAHGPIVATYHASAASSRALKVAKVFLTPMLEKVRGGIAVSEMARRWQVEQLGGDPVLIPNGVDTSVYQSARTNPTPPVEIVFLGRLDESRKGLDILLQALAVLERDVKVTVMGGGQPREVPGVEFLGRVTDAHKAEVLGRADIYVAPNLGGESFGIVLVEAMAAGCAVVASDLEAFAAVCNVDSPDPAGLLFATGNAADLAVKLRHLIDNPDSRAELVRNGTARAELYDWDHVASQVMQVYETVCDGTRVTA
ncbi:GDP-mannose-dependent alpha-(1-2)-phosphatidylinositol mannosyltransferase [Corynebacterium phocae]|uniref:GDP-mannose-dependent alpha-(1-2)-phosphatidylinositol mannosyltransferase n=1 Tax=Corynebacterium phocae TaxID=161895 RepID=A0A1L7D2U8_9CORY|nr:glycosyltransferase family 4 protein [Corynebacterium phocae]APT92415.1 GDP-mannose-dependent alpha-(1-2)-phosphatidylinositol mannosyltransferase [Corynebacterium phocae]KAA8725011.1 glycosyltransferase family 4 protein [Corynebacterium phocae]